MHVLGISGSLRRDSWNTRLVQALGAQLGQDDTLDLYDGLRQLPAFDQDLEADPPLAVHALRQAVQEADAVVISTPEYNGSIPGALKNALDWASRPYAENAFRGKPVVVVGASTGQFGAQWAQSELRKVLGLMGASLVDVELAVAKAHERIPTGDETVAAGVRKVADSLSYSHAVGAAAA